MTIIICEITVIVIIGELCMQTMSRRLKSHACSGLFMWICEVIDTFDSIVYDLFIEVTI